ncbi:MAG: DUF4384 domain-containing protein [Spirochaetales bacterium]|nr:DUF4384 domain-containing protein [Spirochaetales bacterium]
MSLSSKAARATLLTAVFLALAAPTLAGQEERVIRFSWALTVQNASHVNSAVDYNRNVLNLRSGDRFRITLRPETPCCFYVFLHDSQRRLFLLFPESLEFRQEEPPIGSGYSLPGSDSWYYLDQNRGVETFYLIASPGRLADLEAATRRYLQRREHPEGSVAAAAKHEVLDEIKRILNENSRLSGKAEKPLALAGDFRGVNGEEQVHGLAVATSRVYVKTIRLRH